jgi:hypothetical protein
MGYPPARPARTRINPAMRAASADRERTVDVLKAGFAEGRLTQDEYDERMGAAYESRTYGELEALVADLPVGPLPFAAEPSAITGTAWQTQPSTNTNSMALASMILGLAEFPTMGLTFVPAIICGHIARAQMRRTGERGDGAAIAGLVLGYAALALFSFVLVAFVLFVSRQSGRG